MLITIGSIVMCCNRDNVNVTHLGKLLNQDTCR